MESDPVYERVLDAAWRVVNSEDVIDEDFSKVKRMAVADLRKALMEDDRLGGHEGLTPDTSF